jgi:glycosyltransferase involved in cell wall biosynthesis
MDKVKGKIVFISHYYWPPHFGGELRIAIERLEELVKKGYMVRVFTSGVKDFARTEQRNGINNSRSPMIGEGRIARRLNRIIYWLWLYLRLLLEPKVDVVHVEVILGVMGWINPYIYGQILLWIAKLKGARIIRVHSLATNDNDAFVIESRSEMGFYRFVDKIVSVSPLLHAGVSNVFSEKAVLSVNGIRTDIFNQPDEVERKDFRKDQGVDEEEVVFSFLGSFEYRKGLDLIVEPFIKHAKEQNWKLWLIGPYKKTESPYIREDEVAELIEPLKPVEDRVQYWGKIDDREELAKILSSSDVFLFPTRREGFGLAPLEAMACGVPVIVSRIPGVTDLANIDGETGYYIEVGDQAGLERKMLTLSADPVTRKRMGKAGNRRINQDFAWEAYVEEWEKIYFD